MSYGVAGHEFNANESTIYIKYGAKLNKNTHKLRLYIDQLTKCDQKLTET